MSITVTTSHADHVFQSFPDATGWNVDVTGYLHIMKGVENTAMFHPQSWQSVERTEDVSAESAGANTEGADPKTGKTPA